MLPQIKFKWIIAQIKINYGPNENELLARLTDTCIKTCTQN